MYPLVFEHIIYMLSIFEDFEIQNVSCNEESYGHVILFWFVGGGSHVCSH